MKNYAQITIRSKKSTSQVEFGRQFLQTMIDVDPRLEPEFIDCVLTRSNTTPYGNLDAALTRWATQQVVRGYAVKVDSVWGAKWKRKSRPSYSCEISHTRTSINGELIPSSLNFHARYDLSVDWFALFRSWCEVSDAQIAMLHHFTNPELINEYRDFEIGSLGAWFNPRFPEIAWAIMLGEDFVQAVDISKLTALGFPVDAVGSGYIVRVTDSLNDVSQRFDYFCERREILRNLLPVNIFVDEDEERRKRIEFFEMFRAHKAKEGINVIWSE